MRRREFIAFIRLYQEQTWAWEARNYGWQNRFGRTLGHR